MPITARDLAMLAGGVTFGLAAGAIAAVPRYQYVQLDTDQHQVVTCRNRAADTVRAAVTAAGTPEERATISCVMRGR